MVTTSDKCLTEWGCTLTPATTSISKWILGFDVHLIGWECTLSFVLANGNHEWHVPQCMAA